MVLFCFMDIKDYYHVIGSLIEYVKDLPIGAEALEGYYTDNVDQIWDDLNNLEFIINSNEHD